MNHPVKKLQLIYKLLRIVFILQTGACWPLLQYSLTKESRNSIISSLDLETVVWRYCMDPISAKCFLL